ncbi:MAG: hypothetical protein IJP62_03180 [Treponema sp.]|nr:hypothetical protein [Treponema sp.]
MNKSLVRNADYEVYTMTLPFSVIRRQKRIVFVRRELEKRHPLFSERCCTDTRLLLRKGKLTAEVTVMDKLRLAEYRKRFPHKRLFLEGKPERAVFRHRSIGAGKKVALCLAIAIFVGVIARHYRTSEESVAVVPQKTEVAAVAVLLSPEKLLASVLSAVGKKSGRISSLKWQGGFCHFSISGCHPEDVAGEISCTVSYSDNEPRFEISLPVALGNHLPEGGEEKFVPFVRHALLENGLVVIGEQIGQKDVTIHLFTAAENIATALKICAEQAELHGWHERELTVQNGENGCDIKAGFSAGAQFYAECSPFQTVAAYSSVFRQKPLELKVRPRVHAQMVKVIAPVREKVGEIKRIDGAVFAYYRLGDGRIVCEVAQ